MKRLIIILAGLAVLVYAASAGMQWLTPRVEQDLTNRVNTALAEQGLLWADVTVDGRDVTLSGVAPSGESRDKALAAASRVFGVAKVTDGLVMAEDVTPTSTKVKVAKNAPSYMLTIKKDGDHVTLSGTVPDQQSLDVLNRLAVTHYDGASHVTNNLTVQPSNAPAGWRSAAGTVLFNMTNLEHAEATLEGSEIMVSGTVLDQMFVDQIQTELSTTLPQNYKLALAVDVVSPSDETPAKLTLAPTAAPETPSVTMAEVKEQESSSTEVSETAAASVTSGVMAKMESFMSGAKQKLNDIAPAAGPSDEVPGSCDTAALATHKVYFDFDRASIKPIYTQTLQTVAGLVTPCGHVEVSGYTDATGSKLYNQWLSQQRAEAGLRALLRDGVTKDVLTAKGYGEQVSGNGTKHGRSQNRRIEFHPLSASEAAAVAAPVVESAQPARADSKVANPSPVPGLSMGAASTTEVIETSATDASKPWWQRFKAPVMDTSATVTSDTAVSTTM